MAKDLLTYARISRSAIIVNSEAATMIRNWITKTKSNGKTIIGLVTLPDASGISLSTKIDPSIENSYLEKVSTVGDLFNNKASFGKWLTNNTQFRIKATPHKALYVLLGRLANSKPTVKNKNAYMQIYMYECGNDLIFDFHIVSYTKGTFEDFIATSYLKNNIRHYTNSNTVQIDKGLLNPKIRPVGIKKIKKDETIEQFDLFSSDFKSVTKITPKVQQSNYTVTLINTNVDFNGSIHVKCKY